MAPATACALAIALLALARDAGVRDLAALPDLVRGVLAALALFAVAGAGLSRLLLPAEAASLRPLVVVPVGAAAASLALTLLGFARLPLELSMALVGAGGVAAWLLSRGRAGGRPRLDPGLRWLPAVAAAVVGLALVPALRAGIAVPAGPNADAHLVTGTAVLLQEAPPESVRLELPVDEARSDWRSKYPIFYALAAVSTLAGLDPIAAFPAVAALLAAVMAVGFALLAVGVLGSAPAVGVVVGGVTGLSAMSLHVALHPYWNQLWGMAMLPFALLFGWYAIVHRHRGAALLCGITVLLAGLAYPLMLPYPVIALAGFALVAGRRPSLSRRAALRGLLAGAPLVALLAVPLSGVVEKVTSAARVLYRPSADSVFWVGDVPSFLPLGDFTSTGGGPFGFAAVALAAAASLALAVPRRQALALAGLLMLCGLAALRLRLTPLGSYFDFKHLSFVAPILLVLAAAGAGRLLLHRRAALAVLGALALAAYGLAAARQVRHELGQNYAQIDAAMLELRRWSAELPPEASVRLDIPSRSILAQTWAAYLLADHLLTAPDPVRGGYPAPPFGTRADYSLSLTYVPGPGGSRRPVPARRPPDTVDPPLRRNAELVLRRVVGAPGPPTASRDNVIH